MSSQSSAKARNGSSKNTGKRNNDGSEKSSAGLEKDTATASEVLAKESSKGPDVNPTLKFSLLRFENVGRWTLTNKKKIHTEILEFVRDVKRTQARSDILQKYPDIDELLMEFIQNAWPLRFEDLDKSYKSKVMRIGKYNRLGVSEGAIILPSSEWGNSEKIDLDQREKELLAKVVWPEFADSYQFNSDEVLSELFEVVLQFVRSVSQLS